MDEAGAAQASETIESREETVTIDLLQEEAQVEQRHFAERPLATGEVAAFQEGTIRIPVRGEEAVVTKEVVVTGEVVVRKARTEARHDVSATLRREQVDVHPSGDTR